MTTLFLTGFPVDFIDGGVGPFDQVYESANAVEYVSASRPTGANNGSFKIDSEIATGAGGAYYFASSETELFVGFGINISDETTVSTIQLCTLLDVDGTSIAALCVNGKTGVLYWAYSTKAGTRISLPGGQIRMNRWEYVEFRIVPHTSNGTLAVKVNGATLYNNSALQTAGADAAYGIAFGTSGPVDGGTGAGTLSFDDIVVNDTAGAVNNSYPGGKIVTRVSPEGNGGTQQWDYSAGASAYELIDDTTAFGSLKDDDTTYMYSDTSTEVFEIAMGSNPIAGTVYASKYMYAAKTTGGTPDLDVYFYNAGAFGSTTVTPGIDYAYEWGIYEAAGVPTLTWGVVRFEVG
jgi:hypothetical protein